MASKQLPPVRVGVGYDVHQLVEGRPLILGGVKLPFDRGLAGHSDADVLVHAVCDALLGAVALGDLGSHFPDTHAQWKDADSLQLLEKVSQKVYAAGYRLANVDVSVVLERPKLRSYIEEMRTNIARVLQVAVSKVSVKATTSEQLGFAGREEGVAAYAVCAVMASNTEG